MKTHMFPPKLVSFTGADSATDIKDLVKLSQEYAQVEWGILVFPEKMGLPRNPSISWIRSFHDAKLPCAAHLCGVDVFVEIMHFKEEVISFLKRFNRVQLNINAREKNFTDEEVHRIYDTLYKENIEMIFQYNDQSKEVVQSWIRKELRDPTMIQFLYDASKGRGELPDVWPMPGTSYELASFRRYAGGLNPENILIEAPKIAYAAVLPGATDYGLDLESGARTKGEFDIHKCYSVVKSLFG